MFSCAANVVVLSVCVCVCVSVDADYAEQMHGHEYSIRCLKWTDTLFGESSKLSEKT